MLLVVLLATLLWPDRKPKPALPLQEQVDARPTGSFPLPPMDLQVPPSPRVRRGWPSGSRPTVGGSGTAGPGGTDEKES